MNTIEQYTLKPVDRLDTPHCLTKGSETYKPIVSLDYFRATFDYNEAVTMRRLFGDDEPQTIGKATGYRQACRYASGWVQQHEPTQPNRDGLTNYETWEMPGAVQHDELKAITANCPSARLKQCHIALDYIDQDYPKPWELRQLLANAKPKTKNARGRRFEGDDGSQTWYLGKKSSTMMMRVYEKGKQLRSTKQDPNAPTDWIRVEFEVHSEWCLGMAMHFLRRDDVPGLAYNLATYFFEGDTLGLMPITDDLVLKSPESRYTANFATIAHMLKQYGPLLNALDEGDLLGPFLSLVNPSRTSRWRQSKLVELIHEEGADTVLKGVARMLNPDKDNPKSKPCTVPF